MVMYWYDSILAYNPDTVTTAKSAVFTAYATTDVANTSPLATVDLNGLPVVVRSNSDGMLTSFGVDGYKQVKLVSGPYAQIVTSMTSILEESKSNAASSAAAQTAAEQAASTAMAVVPPGGTAGQALVKLSGADRDTGWRTVSGGGSGGGAVTSVAGRSGDVDLTKSDVGLAQVDNTADSSKPVSTLQAALIATKAALAHTHGTSDITGLQTALDSKAGVNSPVNASQVNAGTGVIAPARLGTGSTGGTTRYLREDGTFQVPPSSGGGGGAVTSVQGETGDVVLTAADVGALPSSYVAPVVSVAGRTGPVVLSKGDVGLGAVDNTADADKPVSAAQAAALAGKAADTAVVKLTGAQTVAGVKTFSSAPVVPDDSFPTAKVAGLVAALAARPTATGFTNQLTLSQTAMDALIAGGTADPNTLYYVTGA